MSAKDHPKASRFGVVISVQKDRLVLLSKTVSRDEAAQIIRQWRINREFASFFPVTEGEARKVIDVLNQCRALRSLFS